MWWNVYFWYLLFLHHNLYFLTKSLTLGILFSTAVTVVVTKLVILDILFLTWFILALRAAVVAKLVTLDILSSTSFIYVWRVVLVANTCIQPIWNRELIIMIIIFNIFDICIIYIFFNNMTFYFVNGHVVWWLATCTWKPKVPGLISAATYVQRWALCSNCLANL